MLHCDAKGSEHKILCKQVLLSFKMQIKSKYLDPKILGFFVKGFKKNSFRLLCNDWTKSLNHTIPKILDSKISDAGMLQILIWIQRW